MASGLGQSLRVHWVGGPGFSIAISSRKASLTLGKVLSKFNEAYERKHGAAVGADALYDVEYRLVRSLPCRGDVFAGKRPSFPRSPRSIAYVGGSITEQREGWRPRFHGSNFSNKCSSIEAFCGNAGSTLLAFAARDWATKAEAVVIEVCVNDGDAVLEGDSNVELALEGLVRSLGDKPVLFVEMFLRDDLPAERLTGTRAWIDADDRTAAAEVYHRTVPKIHRKIAARYGAAVVDLCDVFTPMPAHARDRIFRDDCHHTTEGAAFVADIVKEQLLKFFKSDDDDKRLTTSRRRRPGEKNPPQDGDDDDDASLPPPLDPAYWRPTAPRKFDLPDVSGGIVDRCPITGLPATWHWLTPGHEARCSFRGRAVGLLTNVGPDVGAAFVQVDQEEPKRVDLVDRWCYYWRQTIKLLWVGPPGDHDLRLTVDPAPPDRSVLKRPITDPRFTQNVSGLGVTPKLWLLWYCVLE